MVQLLTESIAIAIEAAFGEGFTIYQESIEQDLKEPCFFVQCLEAGNLLFRGNRYFRAHQMCVQYFPRAGGTPKADCEAAAERLYTALEWLELHDGQGTIRGKKMRHRTESGVLSFFVDYDLFVKRELELCKMQTLDVSMQQKKGEKTYDKNESGRCGSG